MTIIQKYEDDCYKRIQITFVSNYLVFVFLYNINHLVRHFENNNLTDKMLFNLPDHLIVFENIKQYF